MADVNRSREGEAPSVPSAASTSVRSGVLPTTRQKPPVAEAPSKPEGAIPSLPPEAFGTQQPRTGFEFRRARAYGFALDDSGMPIMLGSGRFDRSYLGYERWEESLTHQQRPVVIKLLQDELDEEDRARFRQEKALLEYLQGHPSIVELLASGTLDRSQLPDVVQLTCAGDFLVLEKVDMTLMERIKGSRDPKLKDDLAALRISDRLTRVLEYLMPVASAVEFAHLVRNVSHRDINPSNILLKLPDPNLAGSSMQVRLADFTAARLDEREGVTRVGTAVPGTTYFQSPEQQTHVLGILVSVKKGSRDVDYFEDLFVDIAKNDTFAVVNSEHEYVIKEVDRTKKSFELETPFAEATEENIRANVQKRVGRPADIYAVGAILYYLMSAAARNPKALYDSFRKFIEYDRPGDEHTIEAYLRREYEALEAERSKADDTGASGVFRYQHFFDANDEPIPFEVMRVVARCMLRNKPDSYCASNDLQTTAVSSVIRDLLALDPRFGLSTTAAIREAHVRAGAERTALARSRFGPGRLVRAWHAIRRLFR